MKSSLFFLFFVGFNTFVYCQNVDYNQIIPPEYPTQLNFEEKLVYLAWQNHPSNKILDYQYNIAKKNKVKANWAWLDIFSAAYNLNEFTINPTEETESRALFYPRYNFGARLDLGMLVEVPTDIKIAKEQVKIASASLDNQKIALRAEVLRAYQNYLLTKELLELQTIATEESFSRFSLNEQQFKNGEITLEQYNEAVEAYNGKRRDKLNAETNFKIAKINIEALIGVPLEEVK